MTQKLLIKIIMLSAALGLAYSAQALTIPVITAGDNTIGSLRSAVDEAAPGDTITFNIALDGIPVLLAGNEILIDKSITIVGNGASNTVISASGLSRVFNITADALVVIHDLTLTSGQSSTLGGAINCENASLEIYNSIISNSTASGDAATEGGGGIANTGGSILLENCTITNNTASGTSGSGGGILNLSGGGLTVVNSTISANLAMRAGGGIEDNSGETTIVTLVNVTLDGNSTGSAPGNGGGIHITGAGDIEITGGVVTGNSAAAEGGGLWNGAGTMTLANVSISGNSASGADADQGGGGIYNLSGTLDISGGIISNNSADGMSGSGGGILNDAGATLNIDGTEISANLAMRAGGGIEDNSGETTIVTLTGVTLSGNSTGSAPGNGGGIHITGAGDIEITGGVVTGNSAAAEGGGLWNGAGTMTLANVSISGNSASGADADQGGGGIYNLSGTLDISGGIISNNSADGMSGSGGGILNDAGATLNIDGTEISANLAMRAGGGIEDNSGESTIVTLVNVTLDGNSTGSAPGNGGGIHITGAGDIEITGGVVTGNSAAAEGGGLWNGSGLMLLNGVNIDGNIAMGAGEDQGGGGVFNAGGIVEVTSSTIAANTASMSNGGGIHNDADGATIITSSTISGNNASMGGGGVANNGSMSISTSTITNNTAALDGGGMLQLSSSNMVGFQSSIVAANSAEGSGQDVAGSGLIGSEGYNLIGEDDANVFPEAANDEVGETGMPIDPNLAMLSDNGGPTPTHALICPSPAIDAGDPADNSQDQRGEAVFGMQRDIGAFEYQEPCQPNATTGVTGGLEGSEIYPNPSTADAVIIDIPRSFGSSVSLQVSSLASGAILQALEVSYGRTRLDIGKLRAGTYLIQVFARGGSESHKLIVTD